MAFEPLSYQQHRWSDSFPKSSRTTSHGIEKKYRSQSGKGCWIGKDATDHDLVVVDSNEIIRSKAVRADVGNADFLIPMCVGPWDLRKSVRKQVKMAEQPPTPIPMLHPGVRGGADKIDDKQEETAYDQEENQRIVETMKQQR